MWGFLCARWATCCYGLRDHDVKHHRDSAKQNLSPEHSPPISSLGLGILSGDLSVGRSL